jgi:hypothetical protein
MRPAGAIFPFDAEGASIRLSWPGGVDAWVYREMARAFAERASYPDDTAVNPVRRPEFFDWPRFRELLAGQDINSEIRQDPWLADWQSICRKTAASGFDRRRIVPMKTEELVVPVSSGPWIGTSPFMAPVNAENGTDLRLKAGDTVDTYFSQTGMLRVTKGLWMFIPW